MPDNTNERTGERWRSPYCPVCREHSKPPVPGEDTAEREFHDFRRELDRQVAGYRAQLEAAQAEIE